MQTHLVSKLQNKRNWDLIDPQCLWSQVHLDFQNSTKSLFYYTNEDGDFLIEEYLTKDSNSAYQRFLNSFRLRVRANYTTLCVYYSWGIPESKKTVNAPLAQWSF